MAAERIKDDNQRRPWPKDIRYRKGLRQLEIDFDDGNNFILSAEFLRVYSPSAEVRGHGPGQEILVTGKRGVGINQIEAIGNYAVRLIFDDGHNSGIYAWDFLYECGLYREKFWAEYLAKLQQANASREA